MSNIFFFHLQTCLNLNILMMPCYKLWLFVQHLFTCFVLVMFIMPSKMFIRVIKMKVFSIKDHEHFRSNKSITNISQDHWISINNFFTHIRSFVSIKTIFQYNRVSSKSFFFSHISWILMWSRINFRTIVFKKTLSHICWVLYWSGT